MIKYRLLRIMPLFLAAALQVMPMVRALLPALPEGGLAPSPWSIILKLGAGTVALLGSYHAVSGASTLITAPAGGFTFRLTNGVFYKKTLSTAPNTAGSWSTNHVSSSGTAAFQMFPNFSITNSSGGIGGTIVLASGIFTNTVVITAWENSGNSGASTSTNFTFILYSATPASLCVTSGPPAVSALANSLTWNLDGGAWQTNGSTNIYLLPGAHVVNYTNIYGWLAPTSQNITLTSSTLTTIANTYTQLFGGLSVNLQPSGTPAGSGAWQIDGSAGFASGAVTNIAMAGTHSLTFSAVSGYTAPSTQSITVTNGATNTITAFYLSTTAGTLQVNLAPAGAVTAGARWQLDGSGIWLPTGVATNAAAGSHTISFTNLSGWSSPSTQTVSLVNGTLSTLTGTYTNIPTGSLQVNLTPAGAVTAGAQWQVDGGSFQTNGAVVSGLTLGSHTVAFKTVTGWTTPVSQTPTIATGTTNTITGTYTVIATGSLLGNISPAGAVTAGAQWQVDGGAYQAGGTVVSSLTNGTHTVAFKPVSGWVAPAGQTPAVTSGTTNTVTGTYVLITAPVITNFTQLGTALTLAGSGTTGAGFTILSTNTLTIPSSNWPAIYSGTVTNGTFQYNATINPAASNSFYRVSSQ